MQEFIQHQINLVMNLNLEFKQITITENDIVRFYLKGFLYFTVFSEKVQNHIDYNKHSFDIHMNKEYINLHSTITGPSADQILNKISQSQARRIAADLFTAKNWNLDKILFNYNDKIIEIPVTMYPEFAAKVNTIHGQIKR